MAKKRLLKLSAMAFAIAILMVFIFPSTATLAVDTPPGIEDVLSFYPKQQFILAFDLESNSEGRDPQAITIPLTYNNLESLEVPVFTSDGSFTVNVMWHFDPDFELVFQIDLSEIADYYAVSNYRLYSLTPNVFLKGETLLNVACDVDVVQYRSLFHYTAPVMNITSDTVNHVDSAYVKWIPGEDDRTFTIDESFDTHTVTLPDRFHDAFFVTDVELDITCSQAPSTLIIGIPLMDAEHGSRYFYESIFDEYWSPQERIPNPPVYIQGGPDVTNWMSGLFGNLLNIELFPGIKLGGLLFCFIAIPVALIFLRLFAGG